MVGQLFFHTVFHEFKEATPGLLLVLAFIYALWELEKPDNELHGDSDEDSMPSIGERMVQANIPKY